MFVSFCITHCLGRRGALPLSRSLVLFAAIRGDHLRRDQHGDQRCLLTAFPELKELSVDTYHWITFPELLHFYSLGQLAPGPNMMMVVSIGAVVAGLPGAAVALVAFFLPTGILTFAVGRLWIHLSTWRWRPAIQVGLGSVAVGLVLAGAIIMGRGALTQSYLGGVMFELVHDERS